METLILVYSKYIQTANSEVVLILLCTNFPLNEFRIG